MEPMLKDQAKIILGPYILQLQEAVKRAIKEYYSSGKYSSVRHIHSARTAACLCHDHIKAEIKREFENVPGVSYSEKRGSFTLNVRGVVVLRFKKFNKNLMSSNIKTNQVTAFLLQKPVQLELEGLPPDGLLHVGYIMNALGTDINKIYVTYRYANVNIWEWDTAEDIIAQPVIEFPAAAPTPAASATAKKRRVKAKDKTKIGDENASNT